MRRLFFICLLMGSVHAFAFDRLQVEGYTLPNGLQLLLKPGTERGHVAIRLVVGVGLDDFACEDKELPHLLEHLLFSGIDGGGEGDLEIITRTELTEANINAAKQVVEREDGGHYSHLQRLLDRQDLGHTASNQLAVELGLKCAERAEVGQLTRDQLEGLRKHWYAPNNMTLIIVGDLDKLLPAYLERTYGQLDPVDPSEHRELPQIQHAAAGQRELTHGWVGDSAKLHWLFPEPLLDDQHDETYDLLKDYLDWALYRQLRLKHTLSYGPWSEREVLGGVGFLSLNADLERENLPEAEQVLKNLQAQLLKDGLDPAVFARLQQAAIARQAWAVQGNSALADYYWAASGDYNNGHFSDPVKRIKAVSLDQTNQAMRQVFKQPGYWRIEKPLLSYDSLSWIGAAVLGLIAIVLIGVRVYRKRIA
jgi:predicted Zn-dependent peptidase